MNSTSLTCLIIRPDRVGDVIISTACLRPLKERYPEIKLIYAARENLQVLFEQHAVLERFIPLPKDLSENPERQNQVRREFAACAADIVVHLNPDSTCQRLCREVGIAVRAGYLGDAANKSNDATFQDSTLTASCVDNRSEGKMHEVEYGLELFKLAGLPCEIKGFLQAEVGLSDRWEDTLLGKLASTILTVRTSGNGDGYPPFVVLNPTAHSTSVRWPAARFAELATRLEVPVVIVGESSIDPSILEMRAIFQRRKHDRYLDLSGKTNLAELGVLLRHARLLITRDTGPSHLAAAVGCPTIQLFGRLEPAYGPTRWRALGDPGKIKVIEGNAGQKRFWETRRHFWKRGFDVISVEQVAAVVNTML